MPEQQHEFLSGTEKVNKKEFEFNDCIFNQLHTNPKWEPKNIDSELEESLKEISISELFSLMSADDVEDIVSAFMQTKGWILIKSTCFRSKPKFEFSMLKKNGFTAHVQVKSGKSPNPLGPEKYKDYAGDKNLIFLFSTNQNPYPGASVSNVHPIEQKDLHEWVINNLWAITLPLKGRILIFLNKKKD